MVSNMKAVSIWATIFTQPMYKPIVGARRRLFAAAAYSFDVSETGTAFSNERVFAYLVMSSEP